MLEDVVPLFERDLFARSEARLETQIRNAFVRQKLGGRPLQSPVNASSLTDSPAPAERTPNAKR